MKCPVCDDVRMREVDKDGVHIDICPECKGIWLDRGELDKLMQGVREVRREYDDWNTKAYQQDFNKHDTHYHSKHKKKKNVFDIFEDLF